MAANASKSVFACVAMTVGAFTPGIVRSGQRDRFDLDPDARRKLRDADRGPGRERLADPAGVDLVHPLEVAQIDEEDGRLDDPVEARAGLLEDRLEVVEDLLGLLGDPLPHHLPVVGPQPELAGDEDEAAGNDRLRIRRALERRGRLLGPNGGLVCHPYSFSGAAALASAPPRALKIASSTCSAFSPWSKRTCSVIRAVSASSRRNAETRSRSRPATCAFERSTFETRSGRPEASTTTFARASSAGM